MKTELSISAVVIVKSRTQQLVRLIQQLEDSSRRPDELVVVWMSPPSDFSLLKSDHFPIRHKFESCGDLKIARARNKGLMAASSSHCLYLNVESVISPLLLEQCAKAWADGSVLITRVLCVDKELLNSPYPDIEANYQRVDCIGKPNAFNVNNNSSMFFMSKSAIETVGGFDETYSGFGINDEDFFQICLEAGLTIRNLDTITFLPNRKHYQCPLNHLVDFVRNAELFHQKWGNYPCQDVLARFAELGLINNDYPHAGIHVMRLPTEEERQEYEYNTLIPDDTSVKRVNDDNANTSLNKAMGLY